MSTVLPLQPVDGTTSVAVAVLSSHCFLLRPMGSFANSSSFFRFAAASKSSLVSDEMALVWLEISPMLCDGYVYTVVG